MTLIGRLDPLNVRKLFPSYLFALPQSESEYRSSCIRFARLLCVIGSGLFVIMGAAVLIMANIKSLTSLPLNSFPVRDFLAVAVLLPVMIFAYVSIKRSQTLNLLGASILWLVLPIGGLVRLILDINSPDYAGDGLTLAYDVVSVVVVSALLGRFAFRGLRLRGIGDLSVP